METLLSSINYDVIEMRVIVITFIIMVNLIISVVDALKNKKFDIKKLPEFISEWTMCVLSVVVIEVIISVVINEPYIDTFVTSIKNVMFISILGCYLKKIYESLVSLGWDVRIDLSKINSNSNNQSNSTPVGK